MAASFINSDITASAIGQSSYSPTYNLLTAAGNNRLVCVIVSAESDSAYQTSSVTLGGVSPAGSVTIRTATSGYANSAWLGWWFDDDLPALAGNTTIAVTMTGAINREIIVGVSEHTEVHQTATVNTGTDSSTSAGSASTSITVDEDDSVAVGVFSAGGTTYGTPTNLTEREAGFVTSSSGGLGTNENVDGVSITLGWTSLSTRFAFCGAVFQCQPASSSSSSTSSSSSSTSSSSSSTSSSSSFSVSSSSSSYACPNILDAWDSESEYETNGATFNVSSGNNRIALVTITSESNNSGLIAISSVTLGGQTLTEINSETVGSPTGYNNIVWAGYLDEEDIQNMSGGTITINWSNSPTTPNGETKVSWASYDYIDQTTPISSQNSNTDAASSTIQAGNVSIGNGDQYIYVALSGQPYTHTPASGYTEEIEMVGPTNDHSQAVVTRDVRSTATVNPTVTWSSSTRLGVIAFALNCGGSSSSSSTSSSSSSSSSVSSSSSSATPGTVTWGQKTNVQEDYTRTFEGNFVGAPVIDGTNNNEVVLFTCPPEIFISEPRYLGSGRATIRHDKYQQGSGNVTKAYRTASTKTGLEFLSFIEFDGTEFTSLGWVQILISNQIGEE